MARILHWGRMSAELGMLSAEAVTMAETQWGMFKELLGHVADAGPLPSPVFGILVQTSRRPRSDWYVARNYIVKWCAFGNCGQLADTLDAICNSALSQIEQPMAQRVLQVVEYVLEQAGPIDVFLELSEYLGTDDGCILSVNDAE